MNKEDYYLQQNIKLAPVYMMEALGYEVRLTFQGGHSYYKDGKPIIVDRMPLQEDVDYFVLDLINGLSVKEAKNVFLTDWYGEKLWTKNT